MKWLFLTALLAICSAPPAFPADLSIALGSEITSLDPHYNNLLPNNSMAEHIFDKLVTADARQQLRPGLAESWRLVDDLTWEFRLRRNVRFHDGSAFTAADVVFSLERPDWLRRAKAPSEFGVFTQAIVEKIVVDPYTIRLKTAAPHPNLPTDMNGIVMVSSRAARDMHGESFDNGKAAVGTGPFKLVRFTRGDRVELARNDDYWGPKPAWEKVTFRMITKDPSRLADLLSGTVNMIEAIPTPDFSRVKSEPKLNIFTTLSNRLIHLQLDTERDRSPFVTDKAGKVLDSNPLKDVRVRHALSKAINRDAIVKQVMDGLAVPAGQLVPQGFFGLTPNLKPDAYDPQGARKLLAEAGYPDGFGLTLHGPNNRYVNDHKVVQAIAAMLTRIGIIAKVATMPNNVFASKARNGEFSAQLFGWGVVTGEASYPLRSLTATVNAAKGWGTYNLGRYSNARADSVLDAAVTTIDTKKREKLLQEATELVIKDYALIPLHFQVNTWALQKPLEYAPRTDERTFAHAVRPGK